MTKTLIISAIIILILLSVLTLLNVLLQYKKKEESAWVELEKVFIKRRDMVPLILESARIDDPRWAALKDKREKLLKNESDKQIRLELENQFENAISAFIAVADGIRDSVFLEAKKDLLKDIRQEIDPAMKKYLDCSRELNDKLNKFPYSIAAKIFRIK